MGGIQDEQNGDVERRGSMLEQLRTLMILRDPRKPNTPQEEGRGDEVAGMGVKGQNMAVRKQSWLGALHSACDGAHFVMQAFVLAIGRADFIGEDKDSSLAHGG